MFIPTNTNTLGAAEWKGSSGVSIVAKDSGALGVSEIIGPRDASRDLSPAVSQSLPKSPSSKNPRKQHLGLRSPHLRGIS